MPGSTLASAVRVRDADGGELAGLVAAHAGDEGEVVVGAARLLARVGPATDAAVVDGIGIGVVVAALVAVASSMIASKRAFSVR